MLKWLIKFLLTQRDDAQALYEYHRDRRYRKYNDLQRRAGDVGYDGCWENNPDLFTAWRGELDPLQAESERRLERVNRLNRWLRRLGRDPD